MARTRMNEEPRLVKRPRREASPQPGHDGGEPSSCPELELNQIIWQLPELHLASRETSEDSTQKERELLLRLRRLIGEIRGRLGNDKLERDLLKAIIKTRHVENELIIGPETVVKLVRFHHHPEAWDLFRARLEICSSMRLQQHYMPQFELEILTRMLPYLLAGDPKSFYDKGSRWFDGVCKFCTVLINERIKDNWLPAILLNWPKGVDDSDELLVQFMKRYVIKVLRKHRIEQSSPPSGRLFPRQWRKMQLAWVVVAAMNVDLEILISLLKRHEGELSSGTWQTLLNIGINCWLDSVVNDRNREMLRCGLMSNDEFVHESSLADIADLNFVKLNISIRTMRTIYNIGDTLKWSRTTFRRYTLALEHLSRRLTQELDASPVGSIEHSVYLDSLEQIKGVKFEPPLERISR